MPALRLLRQVFGKPRTSDVRDCPPKSGIPWIILAFVLAGSGWVAYHFGWASRSPETPPPPSEYEIEGLVVAAAALDLGEPWESTRFNWTLPIENRRTTEVRIRDFVRSCTCLDIEPPSLVIPPGETREVRLTLDLTERERARTLTVQSRDFRVTIAPRVDGESANGIPKWWTIHGRVHSAIVFDRQVVDLGRHSEESQPLPSQKAFIGVIKPTMTLTATSSLNAVQVKVEPVPGAPGRFELTISPGRLPIGQVAFTITVVPHTSDGEALPGVPLAVTGRIMSNFQTSPPEILFGTISVGETVKETVTLRSLNSEAFAVTGIASRGSGMQIERMAGEGSGEMQFLVTQRILKAGRSTGQLVFQVRTADGKKAEVVIPVSYLGLDALSP